MPFNCVAFWLRRKAPNSVRSYRSLLHMSRVWWLWGVFRFVGQVQTRGCHPSKTGIKKPCDSSLTHTETCRRERISLTAEGLTFYLFECASNVYVCVSYRVPHVDAVEARTWTAAVRLETDSDRTGLYLTGQHQQPYVSYVRADTPAVKRSCAHMACSSPPLPATVTAKRGRECVAQGHRQEDSRAVLWKLLNKLFWGSSLSLIIKSGFSISEEEFRLAEMIP